MATINCCFFSDRLKELRKDMSQADFARKIGLNSQQAYQRYEHGRIPSAEVLNTISQRCGVTVGWLLGTESHTSKHDFDPALMAMPKDVHSRLLWLKGAIARIESVDERTRHHFCAAAETEIDSILRLCDSIIEKQSAPAPSETVTEQPKA
jgi:transcriptional regulator with XRE-family HTH domain